MGRSARRLAKLLVGDLEGDVGATESGARQAELGLEDGGVGVDVDVVDLDSLDGGEGAGTLGEDARLRELLDDLLTKGEPEHEIGAKGEEHTGPMN